MITYHGQNINRELVIPAKAGIQRAKLRNIYLEFKNTLL